MEIEILNVFWKYKLNIDEFVEDFIYNEYFKARKLSPYAYYKEWYKRYSHFQMKEKEFYLIYNWACVRDKEE